ncbi:uncharacterized protein LOC144375324 [Ictidomys tridecemlineatus]
MSLNDWMFLYTRSCVEIVSHDYGKSNYIQEQNLQGGCRQLRSDSPRYIYKKQMAAKPALWTSTSRSCVEIVSHDYGKSNYVILSMYPPGTRRGACGWIEDLFEKSASGVLSSWLRNVPHATQSIVVYQNGVGDGQLCTLLDHEILQLMNYLEKLLNT